MAENTAKKTSDSNGHLPTASEKVDRQNGGAVVVDSEPENKDENSEQRHCCCRCCLRCCPSGTCECSCLCFQACLQSVSYIMVYGLEELFTRVGRFVGRFYWLAILLPLMVTGGFCAGFIKFYQATEYNDLWVPDGSTILDKAAFVGRNFPSLAGRYQYILVIDDNVLTADSIRAMYAIDKKVKEINVATVPSWDNICYKLNGVCFSTSLLELWSFNETVISNLTDQDVIDMVNTVNLTSPVYLGDYYVDKVLSEISRDANGNITGAKAHTMVYALRTGGEVGSTWETEFIDIGLAGHSDLDEVLPRAIRSFQDAFRGQTFSELQLLSAGYALIITYVVLMVGNINLVEHRIYVGLLGVVAVGMATGASIGFCSLCGVAYGPIHSIMPFLLIGVGVDDMFIIVQAWENLTPKQRKNKREAAAQAMKHAGVSITVTSITDLVAFGIGATTPIPALRSFCIYVAVAIVFLFLFQCTFFMGALVADQYRREARRDSCCCFKHNKDYEPFACSRKSLVHWIFEKCYSPVLLKIPVKVLVLLITFGLAGWMAYGTYNLKQDFNFVWYLPAESYVFRYTTLYEQYFPEEGGVDVGVYIENGTDYYNERDNMEALYNNLRTNEYIDSTTVVSWYHGFMEWIKAEKSGDAGITADNFPGNESYFYTLLEEYFATPFPVGGDTYASDVKYDSTQSETWIYSSRIRAKFIRLSSTEVQVRGMDSVVSLANSAGFPSTVFPYASQFRRYETNKIIQQEVYRNIGLAMLAVMVVTLLLVADLLMSLYITLCVVLTLVDLGGLMHFWGLTIELSTMVILVLAVGLAVDYSAHIGHTFMLVHGTRNERAKETLLRIGTAVFNGGFSTFLAFVLLSGSQSYIFQTFFKVFFGVVLFGLWHGLVFLPVICSLIGPAPYRTSSDKTTDQSEKKDDIEITMDDEESPPLSSSSSTTKLAQQSPEATTGHYNPAMYAGLPEPDYPPYGRQANGHRQTRDHGSQSYPSPRYHQSVRHNFNNPRLQKKASYALPNVA
ncbi:patched domain-containing protein 3-like [Branchiostoma floridae x Branchiostoma belcheri]